MKFKTKELKNDGLKVLAMGVGYKAAQLADKFIPETFAKFSPFGKIGGGLVISTNTSGLVQAFSQGVALQGTVAGAESLLGMAITPSGSDSPALEGLKGMIRGALGEAPSYDMPTDYSYPAISQATLSDVPETAKSLLS